MAIYLNSLSSMVHFFHHVKELNPIRTGPGGGGGVFHQFRGFANNFGSNKGTQSKLGDFS